MIQPFCSVYTKSYRSFERPPDLDVARPCLYFSELKENFLPTEDSKEIYNPERDEEVIKNLHLKRLISTYQESYCMNVGKKSLLIDPNDLDADEFMVFFNNYFGKKTKPVPRPLDTARRVHGYCRYENYYTGKTTYEEEISKEAYKYFKRDYDRGKNRLFWKKQQAMQKLREGEKSQEKVEEKREKEGEEKGEEDKRPKEKTCVFCCEKYDEVPCVEEEEEEEGGGRKGGRRKCVCDE